MYVTLQKVGHFSSFSFSILLLLVSSSPATWAREVAAQKSSVILNLNHSARLETCGFSMATSSAAMDFSLQKELWQYFNLNNSFLHPLLNPFTFSKHVIITTVTTVSNLSILYRVYVFLCGVLYFVVISSIVVLNLIQMDEMASRLSPTASRLKFNIFCHKHPTLRPNPDTCQTNCRHFQMWQSHLNKRFTKICAILSLDVNRSWEFCYHIKLSITVSKSVNIDSINNINVKQINKLIN